MVNAFLRRRQLPDKLDTQFIEALREVLSGLTKVTMKSEDLRAALLKDGSPATLTETRRRFQQYLEQLSRGREPERIRIVLE